MPRTRIKPHGRSLLLALRHIGIAFLAVYAARSHAEEARERRFNTSALALTDVETRLAEHNEPALLGLDISLPARGSDTLSLSEAIQAEDWDEVERIRERPDFIVTKTDKAQATQSLNGLFAGIFKNPLRPELEEVTKFFERRDVQQLLRIADLSKIRFPYAKADYGYVSLLKVYSYFSLVESFDAFCQAAVVDWASPDTAQAKNWLLMLGQTDKIKILHKKHANVFEIPDGKGRPIDWLFLYTGEDAIVPSVDFLVDLEQAGIINIARDLRERAEFRKTISNLNNFALIRPFLPEPSHPQYSRIVYDIAYHAFKNKKANVVQGCLSLPHFDLNVQSGENNGQTLLILAAQEAKWDLVERLIELDRINPYLKDKMGRSVLHYIISGLHSTAVDTSKPVESRKPIVEKIQAISMRLMAKYPGLIFQRDYSGKMPTDSISSEQRESLDAHITRTYDDVSAVFQEVIRDMIAAQAAIDADYSDTDFKGKAEAYKQAFKDSWDKYEVDEEGISLVDLSVKYKGYSLMDFIAKAASVEHFDRLMYFDFIPWHKPEYAAYREVLYFRLEEGYLFAKRLKRWGEDHGHGDIANLPNHRGLKPILAVLEGILKHDEGLLNSKNLSWFYWKNFALYEESGIFNFQEEFGISGEKLFSLPIQEFSQRIRSRVKEVSSKHDLYDRDNLWLRIFLAGSLMLTTGLLLAWSVWSQLRGPAQTQLPEAAPEDRRQRRRQRIAPVRAALPVATAAVEGVDPALSAAKQKVELEQANLLKDLAKAQQDKKSLELKKDRHSTKQHTLQESAYPFVEFYSELILAYEDLIKQYEAYITAVNKALEVFEKLARDRLNPDLIKAKEEAARDLSILREACLTAQAGIEDRDSRLLVILKEKEQEFKDRKFAELSVEFKSGHKPLIKLARLTGLVSEIQVVKHNEAETEKLENYRSVIGELEAGVKALLPQDFSELAENTALSVLERIRLIRTFCRAFKTIGDYKDHTELLQAAYRDANKYLKELHKEKKQLRALLDDRCKQIEQLSKQEGRPATLLEQAKKHYEEAGAILLSLGLPETQLAALLEIIRQLQAKVKAVPAAARAEHTPETGGAARFMQELRAVAEPKGLHRTDLAAIQYTSQLLCLELNNREGQAEETVLLALIYNFARLLELLKPVMPEARELRNQLIHRYYVALAEKEALYRLLEAFFPVSEGRHSDKKFLAELERRGAGEMAARLQASVYYKSCCRRGEDYRFERRSCPEVASELASAIRELQAFKNNKAIWKDCDKSPLLAADSQPLLRDAAKMRVVIVGEILKGKYAALLIEKLRQQACDTRGLMSGYERLQDEDEQGNIGALRESISLLEARNVAAHHVHLVSMDGLFNVSSELDVITIGEITRYFAAVDPAKLLSISADAAGGAGSASLVMAASAGAAGYVSPSGLSAYAKPWVPGGGSEFK